MHTRCGQEAHEVPYSAPDGVCVKPLSRSGRVTLCTASRCWEIPPRRTFVLVGRQLAVCGSTLPTGRTGLSTEGPQGTPQTLAAWFGSHDYWHGQVALLREQLQALQEEPLVG